MSTPVIRSIQMIKENQSKTGAFIASPAYHPYRYAWLRDGSFTAYALDRVGEHESARRFYQWCSSVIERYSEKANRLIAAVKKGEQIDLANAVLHPRYTISGDEVEGEWGNFQLDGYGTWLWGLAEHIRMTEQVELITAFRPAIRLTIEYLEACWKMPHHDCWEENGNRVHLSTLAAIYGGSKAIAPFLPERREEIEAFCHKIKKYVLTEGIHNGRFCKSIGLNQTDASLIWLAVPFQLVDPWDFEMRQTVQEIEAKLQVGGGVHRYPGDVYYGGGLWILLSGLLGWYFVRIGERDRAMEQLRWMESKFTDAGLAEQVTDQLLFPEAYQKWCDRAGPPANPLIWSHAMHLVLARELGNVRGNPRKIPPV